MKKNDAGILRFQQLLLTLHVQVRNTLSDSYEEASGDICQDNENTKNNVSIKHLIKHSKQNFR